jgi:signal recognition particle receptor subunit beta
MLANSGDVPYIVVANKQDLPKAWSISAIRKHLDIPNSIQILPCIAKDRSVVMESIKVLLHKIGQAKLGGVKV